MWKVEQKRGCPYRKLRPAMNRGADGCDRQIIEDKSSTERTGSSG
jgi:hypothetical protein